MQFHLDVYIIHGPNLNLLGKREPHLYGTKTSDDLVAQLRMTFPAVRFHYFQSNHEGRLIDKLHEIGFLDKTAIILNAAAYTHTSIALADAVAAIDCPVAEVHLTDIESREPYRRRSFIREHAVEFISGRGFEGYHEAVKRLLEKQDG